MKQVKITWKRIILNEKPVVKFINLCNATQYKLISFWHGNKIFVGLERCGAFFFDVKNFKSGEYVSEKLQIHISDANNIADWINAQLCVSKEIQGTYSKEYLDVYEAYSNITVIQPIFLDDIPSDSNENVSTHLSNRISSEEAKKYMS